MVAGMLLNPAAGRYREAPVATAASMPRARRSEARPPLPGLPPAGGAEAFGLKGGGVDGMAELSTAIRDACAAQVEGTMALVEMVVNKKLGAPFRRDAMQDRCCLLPRYRDLTVKRPGNGEG